MREPITRAYVFSQTRQDRPCHAGTLWTTEHTASFEYSDEWLDAPLSYPLDPVNLPLLKKTFTTTNPAGVFGVMLDAGPDDWGTRIMLMEHEHQPKSKLEELLLGSGRGLGVVRLSLSRKGVKIPATAPDISLLDKLQAAIKNVDRKVELSSEELELIAPGASLGGARPKAVVLSGETAWLVKFSRNGDIVDIPKLEYATMSLLPEAGINCSNIEFRDLGAGKSAYLIERFDRTPGKPAHFISANSLFAVDRLRTVLDSRKNPYSYINLASILRKFSNTPEADCHELFRRMVFNIMVGNTDDHARNHAMMFDINSGQWSLAPAYDILPTIGGVGGRQAMGVGLDGGASTQANALSLCGHFILSEKQARAQWGRVYDAVALLKTACINIDMRPADINLVNQRLIATK